VKKERVCSVAVRMPESIRDRVREAAEADRRSMNGWIVIQLEQALPKRQSLDDEPHHCTVATQDHENGGKPK
jgi:hypothetical protein